jgi:iron complex outermembrane receptor protein
MFSQASLIGAATLFPILSAAQAQDQSAGTATSDEEIGVTAQRRNQTQVLRSGSLGVLGDKDAMEVPLAVKGISESLILNQQSRTLGQVLENEPSVCTIHGFANASEQFVVRGFPLNGEDIAIDGLYGITPRQLVSPELYDQVQILNGATVNYNSDTHFGGAFDFGRRFGDGHSGIRISGAGRWGDVSIVDEYRASEVLGPRTVKLSATTNF